MSSAPPSGLPTLQDPPAEQTAKKSKASKKDIRMKVSKPEAPKMAKPKALKVKTAKIPSDHPTYFSMIKKAVAELKEKKGSSRTAILKYIMSHYQLGENPTKINAHLKMALRRAVQAGKLKQVKGVGASGSFRLDGTDTLPKAASDAEKSPKKKRAIASKPPVEKKAPKKAVPKKSPVTKKAKPVTVTKPEVPASVSSVAVKPKAAPKSPKKGVAKKAKLPKKAPKKIAKKPKTPKKAVVAKKAKTPKKASAKPSKTKVGTEPVVVTASA